MADPAENLDNPITDDGAWREEIAGDDEGRLEALKAFDSPADLFDKYNELADRNWRDQFVPEDDPEFAKTMERFKSPTDFTNSFKEAQSTIRAGAHKVPGLPENATEEQIAAYRDELGIPEEAAGYLENLPEGLVIGEDDAAIAGEFLSALHAVNAPPEIAHAALAWYNDFAETQQEMVSDFDAEQFKETEDELRKEWGADYRANINLIGGLLDKTFGAETKEALLNARDPDGRGLFNIPEFMDGMATLARQIDPINAIVPPGGDPQQTLNDEIEGLEKYMREDRKAYMKDEKAQARLRELYDIRLKHEAAQG